MNLFPPWHYAVPAAVLAVGVVVETAATGASVVQVVAVGMAAAALAWVRASPVAVAAVVLTAYAVAPMATNNAVLTVLPYLVSLAFVGRFGSLRASVVVAVAAALVLGLTDRDAAKSVSHLLGNLVYFSLFSGVLVAGGQLLKYGDRREREIAAAARRIDEGSMERERLAVESERARIARELHDVIAQALTVIGVHAAVVRTRLDDASDMVEKSLDRIETATEQAATELRRLLGLLRENTGSHEPLPHLGRLGELVADAVDAGLTVTSQVSLGSPLAPALDLAAYRIVQEALTNCRRHASGSSVNITISDDAGALIIEILNTAGRRAARESGSGFGVIGMRERVAIYEGALEAGPTDDGGFRLRAEIPFPDSASATNSFGGFER